MIISQEDLAGLMIGVNDMGIVITGKEIAHHIPGRSGHHREPLIPAANGGNRPQTIPFDHPGAIYITGYGNPAIGEQVHPFGVREHP